jgi:Tfp pilus assembly protein PilP
MRSFYRLVFAMFLALAAAACGDDEGPTTQVRGSGRPIARPPARPATAPAGAPGAATGSAPAASAPPETGPFVYKPGRDPFQSYFDITGETQEIAKLEPLQKHDLSKLKVIAIVTGTVQPAAMILDPTGKPFLVKRGALVGPPRGRVARILSDRVVVEREYKDRLERVHKLVHELKIRPDEEDAQREQRP